MNEERKRLFELLSSILNVSYEDVNEEMSPDNTPSWDSFNGLMLAAELEKTFDVKFEMEEIITTRNVGDIVRNLKGYGIEIE